MSETAYMYTASYRSWGRTRYLNHHVPSCLFDEPCGCMCVRERVWKSGFMCVSGWICEKERICVVLKEGERDRERKRQRKLRTFHEIFWNSSGNFLEESRFDVANSCMTLHSHLHVRVLPSMLPISKWKWKIGLQNHSPFHFLLTSSFFLLSLSFYLSLSPFLSPPSLLSHVTHR